MCWLFQQIVILILGFEYLDAADWVSYKEDKCKIYEQLTFDCYRQISNDVESSCHCATLNHYRRCAKFLYRRSTGKCLCVWDDVNNYTQDKTLLNDMISHISDNIGPTKIYGITGHCGDSGYDWIPEIQTCIKVVSDTKTHSSATRKSSADDAHLFVSSTRSKTMALNRYLICRGMISPHWIGLEGQEGSNGEYRWVDGSPLDYEHWYPGEPDFPNDYCVRITYENGQFYWKNIRCSSGFKFNFSHEYKHILRFSILEKKDLYLFH